MDDNMAKRPRDTLFFGARGGWIVRHEVNRHERDIGIDAMAQHLLDIVDQRIGQMLETGFGDDILILRQLKRHMPLLHVDSWHGMRLTRFGSIARHPDSLYR